MPEEMYVVIARRNVCGKCWKKEMCVANAGRDVWQMLEEMCGKSSKNCVW